MLARVFREALAVVRVRVLVPTTSAPRVVAARLHRALVRQDGERIAAGLEPDVAEPAHGGGMLLR
jgi:hypothetical protein